MLSNYNKLKFNNLVIQFDVIYSLYNDEAFDYFCKYDKPTAIKGD
jgi:hypothetical protein